MSWFHAALDARTKRHDRIPSDAVKPDIRIAWHLNMGSLQSKSPSLRVPLHVKTLRKLQMGHLS